jgi:hypothetical protein
MIWLVEERSNKRQEKINRESQESNRIAIYPSLIVKSQDGINQILFVNYNKIKKI